MTPEPQYDAGRYALRIRRPVMAPHPETGEPVRYSSLTLAAKAHSISPSAVHQNINRPRAGWGYADE